MSNLAPPQGGEPPGDPYQAPHVDSRPLSNHAIDTNASQQAYELGHSIRRLKRYCIALAILLCAAGAAGLAFNAVAIVAILEAPDRTPVVAVLLAMTGAMSILHAGLGVAVGFRQIWAVWIVLGWEALSLLAIVLNGSRPIASGAIVVAGLALAVGILFHWNKLRAARIPGSRAMARRQDSLVRGAAMDDPTATSSRTSAADAPPTNPYQAPVAPPESASGARVIEVAPERVAELAASLRIAHGYCTFVGAGYGLVSLACLAFSALTIVERVRAGSTAFPLGPVVGIVFGLIQFALGAGVSVRFLFAVRATMAIASLFIFVAALQLNGCGMILPGCVLGMALAIEVQSRTLRDAGIPLTAEFRDGEFVVE